MATGVDAWLRWLAGIVAVVVGLPILLVYALYWYGDRELPERLPDATRHYPSQLRRMYWQVEHGGHGEPAIDRLGPLGTVVRTFRRTSIHDADPSLSLPGRAAVLADTAGAAQGKGQRILREMALGIRLRNERKASDLIDLVLERSYFPGDVHGIDAAAQANYGVPLEALTREEALALLVTMRSPSMYSPQCGSGFEQRYLELAQRQGLPASEALAAARRRLRPMPCGA